MCMILLKSIVRQACYICIFLAITSEVTFSQTSASKKQLNALTATYREGKLPDTLYLRRVDSIVRDLLNDDSLVGELATYRQVAFGKPGLGRGRMMYYRYLAYFSINKNNYGSAI